MGSTGKRETLLRVAEALVIACGSALINWGVEAVKEKQRNRKELRRRFEDMSRRLDAWEQSQAGKEKAG